MYGSGQDRPKAWLVMPNDDYEHCNAFKNVVSDEQFCLSSASRKVNRPSGSVAHGKTGCTSWDVLKGHDDMTGRDRDL